MFNWPTRLVVQLASWPRISNHLTCWPTVLNMGDSWIAVFCCCVPHSEVEQCKWLLVMQHGSCVLHASTPAESSAVEACSPDDTSLAARRKTSLSEGVRHTCRITALTSFDESVGFITMRIDKATLIILVGHKSW